MKCVIQKKNDWHCAKYWNFTKFSGVEALSESEVSARFRASHINSDIQIQKQALKCFI